MSQLGPSVIMLHFHYQFWHNAVEYMNKYPKFKHVASSKYSWRPRNVEQGPKYLR